MNVELFKLGKYKRILMLKLSEEVGLFYQYGQLK